MLPNLSDSRRTEWTLTRMLGWPRKVERKWFVLLWIAACPRPRLRANSIRGTPSSRPRALAPLVVFVSAISLVPSGPKMPQRKGPARRVVGVKGARVGLSRLLGGD